MENCNKVYMQVHNRNFYTGFHLRTGKWYIKNSNFSTPLCFGLLLFSPTKFFCPIFEMVNLLI